MATRTKRPPATKTNRHLGRYFAKRDLSASGEPGAAKAGSQKGGAIRQYVIQKHDASRLHYDFRLEMEGVLRSWAVPKGIPTKTGERVLAVEVEDHPISYGDFEGVIPEGNYGAGTVMLWDRGNYTVAESSPEEAYRQGKIHFALAGEKCIGEWTLVRMQARPGDKATNWLLIKNSGPVHHAPMTGVKRDISVASGRTLDEIAHGRAKSRVQTKEPPTGGRGRRQAPVLLQKPKKKVVARRQAAEEKIKRRSPEKGNHTRAEFIPPMKALSTDALPVGTWRLEIKLDGYRAVAVIDDGNVELWSRNRKSLTADYPEVVAALKKLPCRTAVIDGEIVALDPEGRSRFQLLQGRSLPGTRPPIVFYAFDLLHLDGRSLLQAPLEERQAALSDLIGKGAKTLRVSPVFDLEPAALLDAVRQQGLEGIIAKAAGSLYEPDRRSGTWLKLKVHGEQEFVIGGYSAPRNSRTHFGALLVGYYDGDDLIYAGKVGTGFNHALLQSLHAEFQKRRIAECPFANLPLPRKPRFGAGMTASAMREVTWLRPELVAQIRFTEWTHDGMLRHPVFLGLRRDKKAKDVVREAAPLGEQDS